MGATAANFSWRKCIHVSNLSVYLEEETLLGASDRAFGCRYRCLFPASSLIVYLHGVLCFFRESKLQTVCVDVNVYLACSFVIAILIMIMIIIAKPIIVRYLLNLMCFP